MLDESVFVPRYDVSVGLGYSITEGKDKGARKAYVPRARAAAGWLKYRSMVMAWATTDRADMPMAATLIF